MSSFSIFLFFLFSPLALSSLVFSLSYSLCSSLVHGFSFSPCRSKTSKPKHHWTQNPLRLWSAAADMEVEFDGGAIWFCESWFMGLGSVVWFHGSGFCVLILAGWFDFVTWWAHVSLTGVGIGVEGRLAWVIS